MQENSIDCVIALPLWSCYLLDHFGLLLFTAASLLVVIGIPKLLGVTFSGILKCLREEAQAVASLKWNMKSINVLAIFTVFVVGLVSFVLIRLGVAIQQVRVSGSPDHSPVVIASLTIIMLTVVIVFSMIAINSSHED